MRQVAEIPETEKEPYFLYQEFSFVDPTGLAVWNLGGSVGATMIGLNVSLTLGVSIGHDKELGFSSGVYISGAMGPSTSPIGASGGSQFPLQQTELSQPDLILKKSEAVLTFLDWALDLNKLGLLAKTEY